jgi:large subunit ribosomal protein L13
MKSTGFRFSDIVPYWYIIDAKGKRLGRLSTEIAKILRGKHKAEYTPHLDLGDYVIVINANLVSISGNKSKDKFYYKHSGFPGGLKRISFSNMIDKFPKRPIELAIKGMLPKNSLGRIMFKKLKVYSGSSHPHCAQNPKILDF